MSSGVDIKQWTNCRVGMLGWALLSLNFALVSNQVGPLQNTFHKLLPYGADTYILEPLQANGPKLAPMVNALLINIYLFK